MSGLVLDTPGGDHVVRWVRADAIRVGERELRASFAVSAAGLVEDWPVTDVGELATEHIDRLLAEEPAVILLGTGATQRQIDPKLAYRALARGVGIEVMTNAAAARTYSILLAEDRRVLAAFILPG